MRTFIRTLGEIRAAILNDKIASLVFHAGFASFIYLMLFFGLRQHLTGHLTFVLAVDSLMLSMTATVLFAFSGVHLCRFLGLKTMGHLGELVYGALTGAAAIYLWSIPYPTVAEVAPSISGALLAGLAIAVLVDLLGLISGAVRPAFLRWDQLWPRR